MVFSVIAFIYSSIVVFIVVYCTVAFNYSSIVVFYCCIYCSIAVFIYCSAMVFVVVLYFFNGTVFYNQLASVILGYHFFSLYFLFNFSITVDVQCYMHFRCTVLISIYF